MSFAHKVLRKSDGSSHQARAIDFFPPDIIQASINGASGVAAWTPAAGRRVRLMSAIVSGATAGTITFFDASVGGATVCGVSIDNTQGSRQLFFGEGQLVSTGNPLVVKGPAGLCNVKVMGQEETP